MKNELGEIVPEHIIRKGKEIGCMKCPQYIYKQGNIEGFPAACIGGKKATRFKSLESANANKVHLGDDWVAFKSPSHAGVVVNGNKNTHHTSNDSAITGSFDGTDGLWKSLKEHRNDIYSEELKSAWDELLSICASFENQGVKVYSRRDGVSCIFSGLKVMQLKLEPSGANLILFKNIHNEGNRSVTQEKTRHMIGSNRELPFSQIKKHLTEQVNTIGNLRGKKSIGYMEKWLHNLLIEGFEKGQIEGLDLEFLYYEVPVGKVKRNNKFAREHADIFARDKNGSLVIIEVKRDSSNLDVAINQGYTYVKWVDLHKEQLKQRTDELDWNVNLDDLKLYVIAPGINVDQTSIKRNVGNEINSYDTRIVLINNDWPTSEKISINKIIDLS